MTTTNRYRIKCVTDDKWEYEWSNQLPTVCPTDAGHTINSDLISIIEKKNISYINTTHSAKVITTSNVTINDLIIGYTLNGYLLALNDNILVKNQTDGKENGVYTVSSSTPNRADFFKSGYLVAGIRIYIESGTVGSGKYYTCSNVVGSDTVDTDELSFNSTTNQTPPSYLAINKTLKNNQSTYTSTTEIVYPGTNYIIATEFIILVESNKDNTDAIFRVFDTTNSNVISESKTLTLSKDIRVILSLGDVSNLPYDIAEFDIQGKITSGKGEITIDSLMILY